MINLRNFRLLSTLMAFLISGFCLTAQDTIRVKTHDQVKVVTDPSKGENRYPAYAAFPKPDLQVRKVNLLVEFRCPDSLQCGEWDYIDFVNLKTTDPSTGQPVTWEIARLITPYGRFFGPKWAFTFKADLSEFSTLLRNEAVIEYVHTGYESNTTCGWKISVSFEFITGPPAARILSVLPMWNGSFPYGDTLNDIEKYLDAKKIRASDKTGLMRLRLIQTGHGMDEQENCAEFCPKYREIWFDGKLAERRDIWSECGTNPVYPQAGTWIFDRANWCPGCMVTPETYDFPVEPGSEHEINVDMQPYRVTKGKPSANYVFSSFLIQCEKPGARNDASVEDIIAPSSDDSHSRLNPAGFGPRIVIRNNGSADLTSLRIEYGMEGNKPMAYAWKGNLKFGSREEVILPGDLVSEKNRDHFRVTLVKPNGKADAYPGDNTMRSVWIAPPIYPDQFILSVKTNRDTAQTAWKITDASGKVLFGKAEADLKPNREYRDTIALPAGRYQLVVTDTAGDGLEFWYNARAGMGQVKLISTDGRLIRSFGSDFGSEIRQSFTVNPATAPTPFQDAFVMVYPHRPTQNTTLMLHFNQATTVKARLTTPEGKLLQEMGWHDVKEGNFTIDLSNYPDAIYMLELEYGGKTEKIRLKKAGRR